MIRIFPAEQIRPPFWALGPSGILTAGSPSADPLGGAGGELVYARRALGLRAAKTLVTGSWKPAAAHPTPLPSFLTCHCWGHLGTEPDLAPSLLAARAPLRAYGSLLASEVWPDVPPSAHRHSMPGVGSHTHTPGPAF